MTDAEMCELIAKGSMTDNDRSEIILQLAKEMNNVDAIAKELSEMCELNKGTYDLLALESENVTKKINHMIHENVKGDDTDLISDGSHTFGELYIERMNLTLFAAKMITTVRKTFLGNAANTISKKQYDEFEDFFNTYFDVMISKKHSDGTMPEGYFIVVFVSDEGNYSYHYSLDYFQLFEDIKEVDEPPEYDGHTTEDFGRLFSIVETLSTILGGD